MEELLHQFHAGDTLVLFRIRNDRMEFSCSILYACEARVQLFLLHLACGLEAHEIVTHPARNGDVLRILCAWS
jgi:hypothetical protein